MILPFANGVGRSTAGFGNTPLGFSSSGGDNPDSIPAATTTYLDRDYDTEVASHVDAGNNDIVVFTYLSSGGYNGSGCWAASPNWGGAGTVEDDGAWTTTGNITINETKLLVIDMKVNPSSEFITSMKNGDHWGHKFLDVRQWNAAGDGMDGDTGRWVTILSDESHESSSYDYNDTGVRFANIVGGAGTWYSNDGTNTNPDMSPWADSWTWWRWVLDAENRETRMYYKRPGDAGVTLALHHPGSVSGIDDYADVGNGWGDPGWISGYWELIALTRSTDLAIELRLDDIKIADGWTDPPGMPA